MRWFDNSRAHNLRVITKENTLLEQIEFTLICYQLYSFVNTQKSCGFVKPKGFMIFYESVDKIIFIRVHNYCNLSHAPLNSRVENICQ